MVVKEQQAEFWVEKERKKRGNEIKWDFGSLLAVYSQTLGNTDHYKQSPFGICKQFFFQMMAF